MKVIAVNDEKQLVFSDQPTPEISADECLIKVAAIGVNRADLLQRAGLYPAPKGASSLLGLEISGQIVTCGKDVNHWQIKNNVFALLSGGGYAEFVKVKANQLIALPPSFTTIEGAAIAEVFLTAYQSLFTIGQLKSEQKVLIHAGASGVGSAAIQLAKRRQCYVVVTVSTAEKAKACLALGADEAIIYKDQDFELWSKNHVVNGFDVIIDVVAGEYLNKNINIIALDGNIVILSMLGGRFSDNIDIAKLLMKRITITASTLRNRDDDYKVKLITDFSADFYQDFVAGKITPVIDSVFSWTDAEQAHDKMAANNNIGKLILTLP